MKIMVVAGEASGDLLAGDLLAALKTQAPQAEFIGLGGSACARQGLDSLFPLEDIAVMGLVEVLPHLPVLLNRFHWLFSLARREKPDVLVTVDAPDFTLRLARKVKRELGIPCVHYVSPSVWAWRRGRAKKMAAYLDHILLLFPFEAEIYEEAGLPATFVGHPVARRVTERAKPGKVPTLALLPGSRTGVIARMLPVFYEAFRLQRQKIPGLKAVVPTAHAGQRPLVEKLIHGDKDVAIVTENHMKALVPCRVALAASGTSNLELAMLGLPTVVGYKMNALTYALARLLVHIPYASPVNWVYGGGRPVPPVVSEFIQKACTAEALSDATAILWQEGPLRDQHLQGLATVREALSQGGTAPAQVAAKAVLSQIST